MDRKDFPPLLYFLSASIDSEARLTWHSTELETAFSHVKASLLVLFANPECNMAAPPVFITWKLLLSSQWSRNIKPEKSVRRRICGSILNASPSALLGEHNKTLKRTTLQCIKRLIARKIWIMKVKDYSMWTHLKMNLSSWKSNC